MTDLQPAYLVLGTDPIRIFKVVDRLKTHFLSDAIEQHIATKDKVDELLAGFDTIGLFSQERLIIVTNVQEWGANDVSKIIDYLKSPAPDVVLMLLADKLATNSRLKKAFAKPQIIACPSPDTPDKLRSWLDTIFRELNISIEPAASRRLLELCCGIDPTDSRAVAALSGNDLLRLRSDAERIAIYAGKEDITRSMVEELATRVTDEKVWGISDAWAKRDKHALLELVEQLISQREHPVYISGALGRHLAQVNNAWHLNHLYGSAQATQLLVEQGVNQWAAKKVMQQAQSLTGPQIDAALSRMALLDAELKGASTLSGRIGEDTQAGARVILERGLLELM